MELTFKLTLDETNVILAALGKVPYEAAAPVVDKLRQQDHHNEQKYRHF